MAEDSLIYFGGVFNKNNYSAVFVGYEMIITNSTVRLVGYLPGHIKRTLVHNDSSLLTTY